MPTPHPELDPKKDVIFVASEEEDPKSKVLRWIAIAAGAICVGGGLGYCVLFDSPLSAPVRPDNLMPVIPAPTFPSR